MVTKADKTIEEVVTSGLCTGCGTCVGICPQQALTMVKSDSKGIYIPQLDMEKCNQCGICLEVCPGYSVDFKGLNLEIFGKEPEDALVGNYLNCYIGHAADYDIRYNSASGGLVTALLVFALEQGMIDGALVTKMSQRSPLEPQPFIARTREEIIFASKSKYCPVAANVALKEILEQDGRFAVVGLPCHIHGIRQAELIDKELREKIVLHLGIFCSHSDGFLQTEVLLQELGLKKQDIAKIDYRGHGWPGMMSIVLKNGATRLIPYSEAGSLHGLWFFVPSRCMLCCDATSELADISCGDAWLPEIVANETTGKSLIVVRSKIGEALCQQAMLSKYVELEEIDSDKVKQAGNMMRSKKRDIKVRFYLSKLSGNSIPTYNTVLLRPTLAGYLRSGLVYFNVWVSSQRYLRRFAILLSRLEQLLISWLRKIY